jgi:hypothetical protein
MKGEILNIHTPAIRKIEDERHGITATRPKGSGFGSRLNDYRIDDRSRLTILLD